MGLLEFVFQAAELLVGQVLCPFSALPSLTIPLVFLALVLLFEMRPIYIALTAGDLLGGLWTWHALRGLGVPVFGARGHA